MWLKKAPLVARQGEVREWHFAHFTGGISSPTERPCEFSFYVSVRMMARQLLDRELTISLPAYYGVTKEPCSRSNGYFTRDTKPWRRRRYQHLIPSVMNRRRSGAGIQDAHPRRWCSNALCVNAPGKVWRKAPVPVQNARRIGIEE